MYTLFERVISICFVLTFCSATRLTSGAIKKTTRNARASHARSTIFNIKTDDEIVPYSDEEALKPNEFLRKSLKEFFDGIKPIDSFMKSQKRSHLHHRNHHRTPRNELSLAASDTQIRSEPDEPDSREQRCKFPFIYDGKTVYRCIADPSSSSEKKWCSLTSNYDRDMLWMHCPEEVGKPVRRRFPNGVNGVISNQFQNAIEKNKGKKSSKREPEEVCDSCDRVPKNNSEAAVYGMKAELNDVDDGANKDIHKFVSKEVSNFIGNVLTKHGVPDTEKKELLALNAKLSTELAHEVSCRTNNDRIVKSNCQILNKAAKAALKTAINNDNSSKNASSNLTGSDELLSNEVDAFISSILSQRNISSSKQKDILKYIRKMSSDIADQISYVTSMAKTGSAVTNKSRNIRDKMATKENNDTLSQNGIHAAVDSFLGLILEKHGVPAEQKKDILDWNAQLSTDIADQVDNILEKASKKNKKLANNHNEEESPLNLNSTAGVNNFGGTQLINDPTNDTDISLIKHLPNDESQPVEKGDRDVHAEAMLEKDQVSEMKKSYDDVSPENDMEISIDGLTSPYSNGTEDVNTDENLEDRGTAPEVVDTVYPHNDEAMPLPIKVPIQGHHNDEAMSLPIKGHHEEKENMTSYANKDIKMPIRDHHEGKENVTSDANKEKPHNHTRHKSSDHKKGYSDENWNKHLTDDGWIPKTERNQETIKDEENATSEENTIAGDDDTTATTTTTNTDERDNMSGEKELDDDEKTMINYVSDSIIQSVKKVKQATTDNAEGEPTGKGKDVTYKKIDSGKKPYLIYRVQQGKDNLGTNPPGIDSRDTQSQKVIPGAKNINIIIINNQNSSLDLSDIENTIAHNDDSSFHQNEAISSAQSVPNSLGTSNDVINKTSENLFLLINTTKTKNASIDNKIKLNGSNADASHAPISLLNSTNTAPNESGDHDTILNNSSLETPSLMNSSLETPSLMNSNEENSTDIDTEFEIKDENSGETSAVEQLRLNGLISLNHAPEGIEVKTFGGNANGEICMFPFIYDGDTYFNCIMSNRDRPWCSVTANYDKLPVWGYCDNEHPVSQNSKKLNGKPTITETKQHKQQMLHSQGEELISKHSGVTTYGGNADGAPCTFPFVYDGQTHMKCIPRDDGSSWCAAAHSYDLHPVWGNCCDEDHC